MSLARSRSLFFMAFVAGALALGISYYLEYAVGLRLCGLCILQRGCLWLLTGLCLSASVHGPERAGTLVYWLLVLICSLAGTVIAWRQVLLQSDPLHHLDDCSTTLAEAFASTTWPGAVKLMFEGTFDCAEISWTLFDLSIPEWSLLFFFAVTIVVVYQPLGLLWTTLRRPLGGESSQRSLVRD
ncbi:disulfide bond formation protein B [Pseudomonas violetae]|jgi:protein dithiol:quinone oxidoreductase|uniref:Disulfide bond formation protein B n=1 Tax=Pseudomonas violetae TaxID=2915813 RepID=A0ABT0EWR2_9PSED|nr:disulfide bond formation protein B [Pseudomonas violetae]MCK1790161.1 disulfide bond formation protein B [Pseudomonas violetae]